MKKGTFATAKIVKKTTKALVMNVVLFVLCLYLAAFVIDKVTTFPSIDLETASATYTITRSDGSSETYDQNRFPLVQYGETLTIEIDPLEDVSDIQNGTLVFSLYHSYVSVYVGDELIYQQTFPEEGKMIGHRYYIIPLPDGYENETIRITAVCAEHSTFNFLQNPKIIPADRTTYAFRSGQFATGILLITLLLGSLFMVFSSILDWLRERRHDGLLSISFLCSCVCLWYMGYSGYMQPFVENATFLAIVEYIGIYLSPIAMSFFIQNHTTSRKMHLFCRAETIILTGFFAFATFMTLFVSGVSYVDYVRILQMIILFTLIILLVSEIRECRAAEKLDEKILHYGITITIGLTVVELIRFLLSEKIADSVPWITKSITPLCIAALVLTTLMYYGLHLMENQYRRIEQENLEQLAYIDQLTGAPNRAAFYQRMQEMKEKNVTDYVVTFIDINFLKMTNDTWGHDKGDELIRTASSLLEKHFTGDDFFGRWGGDEFIAVHFGTLEETEAIMNSIQQEMDEMNGSGEHDFTLSEAWGFAESTSENPLSPEEAIRRADGQMYAAKQKAHTARR